MQRGIVLLLGASLACAKAEPPPPPPPPAIDTVAATQGTADLWARWSRTLIDSNSAESYTALYADDAVMDVQGMPRITGKAALDAVVRPMFSARDYTGAEASQHTTVVVSNDLVLQGGTFAETYVENKKTSVEHGRYAASIARGADGLWRFAYVMAIIDSTVARR